MKRIGLLTFAIVVTSGCFKNNTQNIGSTQVYVKSTYALPKTLDPAQMNDVPSLAFSEIAYEGLLRLGTSFDLLPALAKSWEIDATGTQITFTLQEASKFHDGSPVTADDVVASLSRLTQSSSVVSKYYEIVAKNGIQAISNGKVRIVLTKKFPPFLYIIAGATAKVFPKGKLTSAQFFKHPVGAGPFKIKSITKEKIEFEAFKDYYGEKPKISDLTLLQSSEEEATALASKNLVHDMSLWPLSGKEKVFSMGQDFHFASAETWIIGMNLRFKPFNSLAVRQKFKHDFDTDAFRSKFYPDSRPAHGYIPPAFPGHVSHPQKLASSIFIKPPKDKITIYFPKGLSQEIAMVNFIKNMMTEKGWNIEVLLTEWNYMMDLYNKKAMQAFVVSMNVDYPSPEFLLKNFQSQNTDNFSGINDKKLDELLDQAEATDDRLKRTRIYEDAAKKVDELALTVNLFHPTAHYWTHDCVENFEPNLLSLVYIDYRKVSLQQDCNVMQASL